MNRFKPQKNSWYISRHIDECNSLFSGMMDAYVEGFICRCGTRHIHITSQTMEDPYYICQACGNNNFTNANSLSIEHLSAKIDQMPTLTHNSDGSIGILFTYTAPLHIDLAADNVRYTTESIISFRYHSNTIDVEQFYTMDEEIERLLKETAMSLIMEELGYDQDHIVSLSMREKAFLLRFGKQSPTCMYHWTLDQTSYMMLSPTTDDNPITLLHKLRDRHHQKSIKRLLYQRYKKDMAEQGSFDALTPHILFQTFINVDLLQTMLKKASLINFILIEHERLLFHNTLYHYYVQVVLKLLEMLKESYSERSIAKLLLEVSENNMSWWYDTIAMYYQFQKKEDENRPYLALPKKLSIASLHNAFIKANRLIQNRDKHQPFIYKKYFLTASVTLNGLTFKLPKTPEELTKWSQLLHNCLYGYADHIRSTQSTVFGVFEQDKLCYAIEIRQNRMTQCYGKYNKPVPDRVNLTIQKWFEIYVKLKKDS